MLRTLTLSLLLLACSSTDSTPEAQAAPGPEATASAEEMPADRVLATWEGGQVTWGDVNELVAPDLRSMEIEYELNRYELQLQALDAKVTEALLQAEAEKAGVDLDTLLQHEIEEKAAQPTEEEIASYYRMVQRQLGGLSLEESRSLLQPELVRQKQIERYRAYIAELEEKAGVEKRLPYPNLPRIDVTVADHDPILGPADAPVTIVQFAEYQCPFCGRVNPTIQRIFEEYDGKVRLVYKDFPLQNHGRAIPAAVAAHCAGEQGSYWPMNKTLLGNQTALEEADLQRYARELSLDLDAYDACRRSGKYEPTISQDMEDGRQAGVSATPSFLINGVFVAGAQPYDRFASLIDEELKGH